MYMYVIFQSHGQDETVCYIC